MKFVIRYSKDVNALATIEAPNARIAREKALYYRTDATVASVKDKIFSYEDWESSLFDEPRFKVVRYDDITRSNRVKNFELWSGVSEDDGIQNLTCHEKEVEQYIRQLPIVKYVNPKTGMWEQTSPATGFIGRLPEFKYPVFMKKMHKKLIPIFIIKEVKELKDRTVNLLSNG